MHPEVSRLVETVGHTKAEQHFQSRVGAFCRAFVQGADFDDDTFLKQTTPHSDGVWEFRITFEPQHRIFGGFLRTGEFIATNHLDRKTLAKGFAPSRARSKAIWATLFPAKPRLSGIARVRLLEDYEHADV